MPSRAHQRAVRRTARELEGDGWNVRADVGHWPNPPTIAGRQPDVVATKRGSRRIIEVETKTTAHQDQHETFRRHAGQKSNTVFIGYVADSEGKRIDQFR